MKKVSEIVNDQFWNLAFRTGFYDFVVMSSYDHSLESITDAANITRTCQVVDVGCGSGRQLKHIGNKLKETGSHWTGLEITPGGIKACRKRISNMGLEYNARVLQADMCCPLPVERESIDIAIAHFSLYVIPEREKRVTALKRIANILKKSGMIYIALPGKNYNAQDQVRSSLAIDENNPDISFTRKLWNRLLFSTIGHMSETVVANRIQKGIWRGFSKDEIESEAGEAGLEMQWVKGIYGDTSLMAAFCK